MKNVLVLYYSQSGQLLEIVKNVVSDLEKNRDINLEYYNIRTKHQFPFPWNKDDFFNAFPETFLQKPFEIDFHNEEILSQKYDLIILGYQVWYLTPSIPVNSFLKTEKARQLLANTPVITVSGNRNMWIMAQEKMKKLLHDCNAKLVGNIALVDTHINHISVITIEYWLMSGKKTRYLGIFPKPGISERNIANATRFGKPILEHLQKNDFSNLQEKLLTLGAVTIKPFLVVADKRANILFRAWAKFIRKKGDFIDKKRLKWVRLFRIYLITAIWLLMPIVFFVFLLGYIFLIPKFRKDKEYYKYVRYKTD